MPPSLTSSARFSVVEMADLFSHQLTLAVRPIDTFTGRPADLSLRASLRGFCRARFFQSQSGFLCLEDLQDDKGLDLIYDASQSGDTTLTVEPAATLSQPYFLQPLSGQPWSYSFSRKIALVRRIDHPDLPIPEVPARWVPAPSYPFPGNATLLRGAFQLPNTPSGDPPSYEGCTVSTAYMMTDPDDPGSSQQRSLVTQAANKGEFVLFFKALARTPQNIFVTARANGRTLTRTTNLEESHTTTNLIFDFR